MRQPLQELVFDFVKAEEIPAAHDLETKGFPADEVTPIEQFLMRQQRAPSLFLGAFVPPSTAKCRRTLVAFACSTRSLSPTFTAESMKTHDPEGSYLCIQNVVVSAAYQRRGIALALVEQIIARVRNDGLTKRVLLICHDNLRPLYEKAGFEFVGISPVILGSRPWDEMRLVLKETESSGIGGPQTVNGLAKSSTDEHASRSSKIVDSQSDASRKRPAPRLLSSFPSGLSEVTTDSKGVRLNKFDVICPRTGCGRTILKSGEGRLVEKEISELKFAYQNPSSLPAPLSAIGTRIACWLVQLDSTAFKNTGFSRSVGSECKDTDLKIKLLSCAVCGLGPIGWCVEDVHEFWLIPDRVGYRA